MPKKNKIPERKKRKEVGIQFKEEDDEEYGRVEKCLGDCRFSVCVVGTNSPFRDAKFVCHLRKAAQKSGRIVVGDTVLFQRRLDSSNTGDIIHRYSPQDANKLSHPGVGEIQIGSSLQEDATLFSELTDNNNDDIENLDIEDL